MAISAWFARLDENNRANFNCNNRNLNNNNGSVFGIVLAARIIIMGELFNKIASIENLELAWRKARKGKTKKDYVIEFEKNLEINLSDLHVELLNKTYCPLPLKTFILRDPKTRVISKSEFRDRIIHHAIVNILEPIFDKFFIYDSCANRKGKGTLFALKRFDKFARKVSKNNSSPAFVLKADIKHYFQEVNHKILVNIISKKIKDERVIWLTKQIIQNVSIGGGANRSWNAFRQLNLSIFR